MLLQPEFLLKRQKASSAEWQEVKWLKLFVVAGHDGTVLIPALCRQRQADPRVQGQPGLKVSSRIARATQRPCVRGSGWERKKTQEISC